MMGRGRKTRSNRSALRVKDSAVEVTHLVLPSDANALGTIFGGKLMGWIDLAAAIAASRHSRQICVTASMDRLDFHHPIRVGHIVILKATVNYVGSTSMEVGVRVESEEPLTGQRTFAATSYLTFVAVDEKGRPVTIPKLIAETDDEKRRCEEAKQRREERLKRSRK
jgi:acyl-CoA hydrolase